MLESSRQRQPNQPKAYRYQKERQSGCNGQTDSCPTLVSEYDQQTGKSCFKDTKPTNGLKGKTCDQIYAAGDKSCLVRFEDHINTCKGEKYGGKLESPSAGSREK